MKELLKKEYHIEIELFASLARQLFGVRGKKLSFTFPSATLRELIELSNNIGDDKDLHKFLFEFLNRYGKITERQYNSMTWNQVKKILEFVIRTYAKGYLSLDSKNKTTKVKAPSSSMIMMIIEKSNETMESLLDLPWHTIEHMMQGIIWNLNEQTEEGRRKNIIDLNLKEHREEEDDETALKKIREMEERMKNNSIKFTK